MRGLVWCLICLAGIFSGCAHVMSEESVGAAGRRLSYGEIGKNPEAAIGKSVQIGGVLIAVQGDGDVTTLEVAQRDLFSNGVPDETAASQGRFLAVSGELLDPRIFRPGLLVTLVGVVKGQQVRASEGADYRFPLVSVREIRTFRATDASLNRTANPYRIEVGDERIMVRPPAAQVEEPRSP